MLKSVAAVFLAGLLVSGTALADPPGRNKSRSGPGDEAGASISIRIGDSDRETIRAYYGSEFSSGRCPPGLSKKNNGCMPPGQAKKWAMGRRLPGNVIYHGLPAGLSARLNIPSGSQYVRVGADILLIAAGTGLILDAIEDLSRQ